MDIGFAPPGNVAPAMLPAAFVSAMLATRPLRAPGGQPGAVVILVEVQTRSG